MNRFKSLIIILVFILPFFIFTSCVRKPPKPGPNFAWVKTHTKPNGVFVPGHWKHAGMPHSDEAWIPGHYEPSGRWVPGHWQAFPPTPEKGLKWVPGNYGTDGRWTPGHWR